MSAINDSLAKAVNEVNSVIPNDAFIKDMPTAFVTSMSTSEIEPVDPIEAAKTISDSDIEMVAAFAEKNAPEEVLNMRESIADTSDVESEGNDDGFSEEIKNISLDSSYEDLLAGGAGELAETSADIFEVANGISGPSDEDIENRAKENLSQLMNLSDSEMISFCAMMTKYRKDKNSVPNVYKEMPFSIQQMISKMTLEQGLSFTECNKIAKLFMDEFIAQAELDETFVDVERSLDEALKMPSIADMYSEHTQEVMNVRIPEIIERIKDTEPENAKLLEDIRAQFDKAYDLSELKVHFNEVARTRKLMRRDCDDPIKYCDEFNFINERSKFKMPDCRSIGPALCNVFIDGNYGDNTRVKDMNITMTDLNKFVILFCRTSMNMDGSKLLDAAYMYYALRNITMLNLTNETKTPFAAELINNICDIIEFIREKEAEFNASGMSKKSNKRKQRK